MITLKYAISIIIISVMSFYLVECTDANRLNSSKFYAILRDVRETTKVAINKNITLFFGTAPSHKFDTINVILKNKAKQKEDDPVPRLIIEEQTGSLNYDYPLFNHKMLFGPEEMLCHNMIMKSAGQVRLFFMFPYHETYSIFQGNVMDLVKMSYAVIGNLKLSKDTIGLIATNIENPINYKSYGSGRGRLVQDVINEVGDRILSIYQGMAKLNWKSEGFQSQEHFEKSREFLKVFTEFRNENYPKITVVEKPSSLIPIAEEIELAGSSHLMKFINKFKFSTFKYEMETITATTILQLKKTLNRAVQSVVAEIGNEAKAKFTIGDGNKMDLDECYIRFKDARALFFNLTEQNITKVEELLQKIVIIIKELDIRIQKNKLLPLLDNKDIFFILNELNGKSIAQPLFWLLGFNTLDRHMNEFEKWIFFLKTIYTELPVHIARNTINITGIIDRIETLLQKPPVEIEVKDLGFFEIMKKLTNINLHKSYHEIKEMKVGEAMLKPLVKTLNSTKYNPQVSCPRSNTVEIKGLVVSSSKINEALKEPCVKDVKFVEVFAFQTFIGGDYAIDLSGKNISLAIIAKDWFMEGDLIIYLIGENGPAHNSSGNITKPGTHGKPGFPGYPGANFFGFAERFRNPGTIRVVTNGGSGGDGENGNKGEAGENGTFPKKFDETKFKNYAWYWASNTTIRDRYFPDDDDVTVYNATFQKDFRRWEVWGVEGQNGRKGGHGGAGGLGGKPGSFLFIDVSNSSTASNESLDGGQGSGGNGAPGGEGGKGGKRIKVDCGYNCALKWVCKIEKDNLTGKDGERGKTGRDGNSTIGQATPESPPKFNTVAVINRFKAAVRASLVDCINNIELTQFIQRLETTPEIIKLYDHISLTQELKSIEEQFHVLHKLIDVLPFYESLLKRIDAFSAGENRDIKLLVVSLYSATYSRVCSLKNNINGFMIIDVHHFLSKLIQDIRVLEELGKEIMLNNYVDDFKKEMDQEVQGVDEMVNQQFLPEMNNLIGEIQNNLKSVVKELNMAERKAESAKQEAEIAKEEARKNFIGKAILGGISSVFSSIATAVSFVGGPIGMAVGAGASAIAGVLDKAKGLVGKGFPDLQKRTKEAHASATRFGKGKVLGMKSQLKDKRVEQVRTLFQATKVGLKEMDALDDKSHLGNLYDEVKIAENQAYKLLKTDIKNVDTRAITATKRNLQNLIKSQIKTIDEKIEGSKKRKYSFANTAKTKSKIDSMKNITSLYKINIVGSLTKCKSALAVISPLFSAGLEVFSQFLQYRNQIKEFDKITEELDKHMEKLLNHKEEIENVVGPGMDGMEDDLTDQIKDLKGKSIAALISSKFNLVNQIEQTERDTMAMVKGFESEGIVKNIFGQLKDLMKSIVDLHEKVGKHNDLKKTAQYQADLQSARTVYDVKDPVMYALLNELEYIMKASALLLQYERAVHALKQYVFPFADYFLGEFSSLPPIDLKGNINSILFTIIPQIEKLYSNLDDWIKNINQYDNYIYQNIHFTYFNRQPFYTYRYSVYNFTIKRLLNGDTVLMTSDIKEGVDKDGVKFNEINIILKLKNETLQLELDEVLKNYDVSLTHNGINIYRCGSKYYVIRSERLTIVYSFKKDISGRPLRTNLVYDKISMNGYLLSPYTPWSIKFIPLVNNNFDALKKFKNEPIDILLEGKGQYIRRNKFLNNICNGKLDTYYTEYNKNIDLDEIIAQIDSEENYNF